MRYIFISIISLYGIAAQARTEVLCWVNGSLPLPQVIELSETVCPNNEVKSTGAGEFRRDTDKKVRCLHTVLCEVLSEGLKLDARKHHKKDKDNKLTDLELLEYIGKLNRPAHLSTLSCDGYRDLQGFDHCPGPSECGDHADIGFSMINLQSAETILTWKPVFQIEKVNSEHQGTQ